MRMFITGTVLQFKNSKEYKTKQLIQNSNINTIFFIL